MESLENTRILIVDDNQSVIEDFRKILRVDDDNAAIAELRSALFGDNEKKITLPNYTIDTANQGLEAVELVRKSLEDERPYAMAFVDILMPPGIDGIETIKQIWKVDREIQMSICTAYANYSWKDIVRELGLSDQLLILKKPFDAIEIRQIACCLVKKWNLAQQVGHQFDKCHQMLMQQTAQTLNSLNPD